MSDVTLAILFSHVAHFFYSDEQNQHCHSLEIDPDSLRTAASQFQRAATGDFIKPPLVSICLFLSYKASQTLMVHSLMARLPDVRSTLGHTKSTSAPSHHIPFASLFCPSP
jgi:hypothetical protein